MKQDPFEKALTIIQNQAREIQRLEKELAAERANVIWNDDFEFAILDHFGKTLDRTGGWKEYAKKHNIKGTEEDRT